MRHSFHARRSTRAADKVTITGQRQPATPTRQPDLNRLAADLAAEWYCRHEDLANESFEVTT